jgi:hypothetical protein
LGIRALLDEKFAAYLDNYGAHEDKVVAGGLAGITR